LNADVDLLDWLPAEIAGSQDCYSLPFCFAKRVTQTGREVSQEMRCAMRLTVQENLKIESVLRANKNYGVILGLFILGLLWPVPLKAQHYVPGVLGIECSTVPSPGLYALDYSYFYSAGQLNTTRGRKNPSANLNAFVYAQVPRLVWITNRKFLGGALGFEASLPIVYQHVRFNTSSSVFRGNTSSVGDSLIGPLVGWHKGKFDYAGALGFYVPWGSSAASPTTRAGLGYLGTMLSAGATWRPDRNKIWSLSALNRYEFNTEQRDSHITLGSVYTVEWGVSRSFTKTLAIGPSGYYQQKVSADQGFNASSVLPRVAAAGPEVSWALPGPSLFVSWRYLYEFAAEGRPQGQTGTLTLTKRFGLNR
jgi:hypothetical protein